MCFFRIEFNLHLIDEKMNHQAGILIFVTKEQIQQRSKTILIWARFNQELAKSNFDFCSGIEFHLHLIGKKKMNHQAGILKI